MEPHKSWYSEQQIANAILASWKFDLWSISHVTGPYNWRKNTADRSHRNIRASQNCSQIRFTLKKWCFLELHSIFVLHYNCSTAGLPTLLELEVHDMSDHTGKAICILTSAVDYVHSILYPIYKLGVRSPWPFLFQITFMHLPKSIFQLRRLIWIDDVLIGVRMLLLCLQKVVLRKVSGTKGYQFIRVYILSNNCTPC